MADRGLSDRHQRFVAEYLTDFNATAAYKRAGYKCSTAAAEASAARLLGTAKVRAAVDAAQGKLLDKLELTAERVLLELARLSFSDVRSLVDSEGKMIPLQDLSDEAAACIVGVEWKDGVPKYKLADKNTALGNALKVLGLLRERVEFEDKTPPDKLSDMELARKAAFLFAKATHEMPEATQ